MTLATCTISPELDAEGKAVRPEVRYTGGALRSVFFIVTLYRTSIETAFSHPYPFGCRIHRRSKGVPELLDLQ